MPNYQVTYRADEITTIRNYYAPSFGEVIDKVIDQEAEDWVGRTIQLNIVWLGD